AGWKIRTGSDQRTGPGGSRLPPGDQPGSARHGIEIGYAYDRERLANSFWASLFFDHEFGDGFRRGDAGELDATYGWWLLRPNVAEELGVNLAVGLHAEASASDRLDGGASALTAHRVAGIHLTPIITKGQAGVDGAKLFLDPPEVRVTLESGVWVDPKRMLQAIRAAGFTPVPENVRMTLTGVLELRDGGCVLKLDRMKTPMELPCVDRRHDGSAAHAPG